ncbi:putative thiamine pyrophosphate enzyme [Hypoxylon sp. FL1284]|nr:putative thiamine pyrophosphate enzyme [Hypoxylon sp. FL1284]
MFLRNSFVLSSRSSISITAQNTSKCIAPVRTLKSASRHRVTLSLTSSVCTSLTAFCKSRQVLPAINNHEETGPPQNTAGPYTTAFALFEALWEAGVTVCFVNVGSDHPSIIEAIVKGKRERPNTWSRIITCPSEVTAISMADGYARVSGRPQAVIVHLDVGTQALGQGVHNASVGRAPVFIFAGMCPYTESGELTSSRTEYTGEVRTGLNIRQTIGRALQFANSAPKGLIQPYSVNQEQWGPIGPSALPTDAIHDISTAPAYAERPLIITGYSGRDRRTPGKLVALADLIPGIRVHDTSGSDMCFPLSHPASKGFRLSSDECTKDAGVILLLDCDVPWIPSRNPPAETAKIYHIDSDPLNQQIPVSFFPANGRWNADSFTALSQLIDHVKNDTLLAVKLEDPSYAAQAHAQAEAHKARLNHIASLPLLNDSDSLDAHNVGSVLKSLLAASTSFVIEAVTAGQILFDQLQPTVPSSWINCGGTGIGWSNGAALGIKMALTDMGKENGKSPSLVCQVVGDDSFMCAAPSSALWIASKYKVPLLTVVLNNGALAEAVAGSEVGWNKELDTAESWMKGVRAKTVRELRDAIEQASLRVGNAQKGMLVEGMIET